MTAMVAAYQENDIDEFQRILERNRESIMQDPFIREHIEELLTNIRTQVTIVKLRHRTTSSSSITASLEEQLFC